MMNKTDFIVPENWQKIQTIEMHTGGEPLRIIVAGLPEIKGDSVLECRRYFRDNFDHIRTGLMWEPRGHADMYGAILTRGFSEGADFGTFFLHNEGYSTMCGHAIIALTKFAVETGMVTPQRAQQGIIIDAPPGVIKSGAIMENGYVKKTSFLNVPSFLYLQNESVIVPGLGRIHFDIAFGGAFYAFVDADAIGLKMDGTNYNRLIEYGRSIKHTVMEKFEIRHPFEEDLSFLYGTIFTGKPFDKRNHSRNVCVFANGEVDRSATGSGVSARAALHYAKGELATGELITVESILGTTMTVKVHETTTFGPYQAVVPEVSGTAHFCGKNEFLFDPDDPLNKGFFFR